MIRYMRYLLIFISIAQIIFAAGFILQIREFTRFWPLSYTNAMSFTFIASITLAAAAAMLWCIVSDDLHALSGIALDYMVIFTPLTVIFFQLASRSSNSALPTFAVVCVLMCLFGAGLFWWSRRLPVRDTLTAGWWAIAQPDPVTSGLFASNLMLFWLGFAELRRHRPKKPRRPAGP
jgi:hypothetical protein